MKGENRSNYTKVTPPYEMFALAVVKFLLCPCSTFPLVPRQNAYELYGADFMLTEDLRPWLLEINSSPSMARTTHATQALVDNVLEDLIKGIYHGHSIEALIIAGDCYLKVRRNMAS